MFTLFIIVCALKLVQQYGQLNTVTMVILCLFSLLWKCNSYGYTVDIAIPVVMCGHTAFSIFQNLLNGWHTHCAIPKLASYHFFACMHACMHVHHFQKIIFIILATINSLSKLLLHINLVSTCIDIMHLSL